MFQSSFLRLLPAVFGLAASLVVASSPAAFGEGATDDVWDVSQGAVVTASSGTVVVSAASDMLGANDAAVEPGTTIFRDDQAAGFVHFVEWHTPAPVTVYGLNLLANDDGTATKDRGFTEFHLFVKNPSNMTFEQVYSFTAPGNPYPDEIDLRAALDPPVTGQDFRAEFVQAAGTDTPARGPRIRELDAAGVPFGGDDTGFVPPGKTTAKCENAVASKVAKLLAKTNNCVRKGAKAAFKAKAFDQDACVAAARAAFDKAVAKLSCPPCLDKAGTATIASDRVGEVAPMIFCAGSTTFGGGTTLVPPDKATAKCADGAAAAFAKLATGIVACHVKLAKKLFAKKPFDEEACEDKVRQKYDKAQAKRKDCPVCLDATAIRDDVHEHLDQRNGEVYCAF